jgi:hypothetical protein
VFDPSGFFDNPVTVKVKAREGEKTEISPKGQISPLVQEPAERTVGSVDRLVDRRGQFILVIDGQKTSIPFFCDRDAKPHNFSTPLVFGKSGGLLFE